MAITKENIWTFWIFLTDAKSPAKGTPCQSIYIKLKKWD